MRTTLLAGLVALVALAGIRPALAVKDGWTTDFAAAKTQAAREKKDLLIDFTGSDWCGWCIKLDEEVFSQTAFKTEAPKSFVLVELDYPRAVAQTDAIKKQNQALLEQFPVDGYPTILMADAQGRPYAKTGYQEGGADAYLKNITELRKARDERDVLLAKAEKAKGLDRAKALDAVLASLEKRDLDPLMNRPWVDEIINLDDKDAAGLKSKYQLTIATHDIEALAHKGKIAEAKVAVDKAVADYKPTGEKLQQILLVKINCALMERDKPAAKTAAEEALKAAPDSTLAPRLKVFIERMGGNDNK